MDLEVLKLNRILESARKNAGISEFLTELSNYLENGRGKQIHSMKISDIENEYGLNYEFSSELTEKRNEILKEHLSKMGHGEKLYYVSYKNPNKEVYQVLEYNNKGEKNSFYKTKEELPYGISIDNVLKKNGKKFEIDEEMTKNILDKVKEQAEKLAERQNIKLNAFRKEGSLYQVVSFSKRGVFLRDKAMGEVVEETIIPKDTLKNIGIDSILRYKNGVYFYEEELTDEFFENLEE